MGIAHIDFFLGEILQIRGIVCPYPYRMGLKMQDNFLVACWTNVLKSQGALKTSIPRSLPNFWPKILSNRSSRGTVYGYVIVL